MNVYTESVDFQHASSDWSSTQTFTVPATSASPSLTPTPTIPEFPTLILTITFLLTATLLGTVMIRKKQSIGWTV